MPATHACRILGLLQSCATMYMETQSTKPSPCMCASYCSIFMCSWTTNRLTSQAFVWLIASFMVTRNAATHQPCCSTMRSCSSLVYDAQALRKPLMAAVLSHLHHTALAQPWGIRLAAVQAIAKVTTACPHPVLFYNLSFRLGSA